jgi:hypothetical protein
MIKDSDFYTVTMARVYENQGLWDKAAEIYRYLLRQEPEREDFAEALSKAERKIEDGMHKEPDDLVPLFREWINLLLQFRRLREMRQLKGRLTG